MARPISRREAVKQLTKASAGIGSLLVGGIVRGQSDAMVFTGRPMRVTL